MYANGQHNIIQTYKIASNDQFMYFFLVNDPYWRMLFHLTLEPRHN